LIRHGQARSEILETLKILEEERPKNILEIGMALGGTLFLFSRVAQDTAHLVSLELPVEGPIRSYFRWRIRMIKFLAMPGQKLKLF